MMKLLSKSVAPLFRVFEEVVKETFAEGSPLLSCGYGIHFTDDDFLKPPSTILDDHEAKIKPFVENLSQKHLVSVLRTATTHILFEKFMGQLPNRKFGSAGAKDLVEFDLWLMKSLISEKKDSKKDAPPATPPVAAKSPPVAKSAVPSPAPATELVEMTPEEKAAFEEYRKYRRCNGKDLLETPTTATPPSDGSTHSKSSPDGVRKKLELGDGQGL